MPQVCTLLEIRTSHDLAKDFGGIDGKTKAIEKKIYKSKNFKLYKERKQNKTAITKKKTIRKEKEKKKRGEEKTLGLSTRRAISLPLGHVKHTKIFY